MSTDQERLALIFAAQEKRDHSPNICDQVVAEIRHSALCKHRWEDLLSATPVALSSIGTIYAVSSSPVARTVELSPPTGGFKYLSFTSLRANLLQCGDQGRMAFIEAEAGMGRIQHLSRIVYNKVADIVDSLMDPPTAQRLLGPQMRSLKNAADDCSKAAIAIDEKFDIWLNYVCEFHAACEQKSSTTTGELLHEEIKLAVEKAKEAHSAKVVEESKSTVELLKSQLIAAEKMFQVASENYPTGVSSKLMLSQLISDIIDGASTAVNQTLPVLLTGIVPDRIGWEGVKFRDGYRGQSSSASLKNHIENDPAYSRVIADMTLLQTLNELLTGGEGGGVDWHAAGAGDLQTPSSEGQGSRSKTAQSSVRFVHSMLNHTRDLFKAASSEASKKYEQILKTAERIAEELATEVQKGNTMSADWPPNKGSALVQGWQTDFMEIYEQATKMLVVAKAIPGNTSGQVPLITDAFPESPGVKIERIRAKSNATQAFLETAQHKLTTLQTAFLRTQQNYMQSSNQFTKRQGNLAEIQVRLQHLTKSNTSLEEIKTVLLHSLQLILTVKEEVQKLVRFFKAFSTTISDVVTYSVGGFLDELTESVGANDKLNGSRAVIRIGDFTLTDLQRTIIFRSTLNIRAYFSLCGDVADMWMTLSKDHIFPGLALAEQVGIISSGLGEEQPSDIASRVQKLRDWSRKATNAIAEMAGEKRREILEEMEVRVNGIAEVTKYLPPPPTRIKKAIEAAATEDKVVQDQAMEQNAAAKPMNRLRLSRIETDPGRTVLAG